MVMAWYVYISKTCSHRAVMVNALLKFCLTLKMDEALKALSRHNKDVVILYLYGCEVFKQDEVGWHQTECLMHEQVRRKRVLSGLIEALCIVCKLCSAYNFLIAYSNAKDLSWAICSVAGGLGLRNIDPQHPTFLYGNNCIMLMAKAANFVTLFKTPSRLTK